MTLPFINQIPSRRRSFVPSPLAFCSLEPRVLLAGISYDATTRIVLVEGTSRDDFVRVANVDSDNIQVRFTGFGSQSFAKSDVLRVEFRGRNGDDIFRNETDVVSHAFGHGGNDSFRGGSAGDQFVGGTGNDTLLGFGGNDGLRGNDGDDILRGGAATDFFFGGEGADQLFGDGGNDNLSGAGGNDVISGGDGNDKLYGIDGDDVLNGDAGDDILIGGNGKDILNGNDGADLLRGDAGDDRLRGGNHQDRLFGAAGADELIGGRGDDFLSGGDGNDELSGEDGNDRLDGGNHNDRLLGGRGNDVIQSGSGNDAAFGNEGRDQIHGGQGIDVLDGGNDVDSIWGNGGNDLLFGGGGNDSLFGGSENDRVYGGSGTDRLDGGDGQDGLFGGIGGRDRLTGGRGSDRFLTWAGDIATDAASNEGVLLFKNETSNWTNAEIRVVDAGLHKIHMRTQDARVIRDSLDKDPVVYSKWANLNGSQAINRLSSRTVTQNGQSTTTYTREIQFADWNERNSGMNAFVTSAAIHEVGHSWDSELEITTIHPNKAGLWTRFLRQSFWTATNPNSSSYTRSGDGEWWYRNDSEFGSNHARLNPREDFATVWEVVLDADRQDDRDRLASKVALVDELFAAF